MNKIINSFKNYLLNKSNQYHYYKSGHAQLKKDIVKLETVLKDLNNKIDENIQLKQEIAKLQNDINTLTYNFGDHPPGHFHSPVNDYDFLKSREDKIWKPEFIDGIKLNEKEQLDLFKLFTKYYPEMPFKSKKQPDLRYYFENDFYKELDGKILYSMMRLLKPKKIIEIGSGFTSALMMDVNNLFFENKIKLTFIEPYPERLYSLMSKEDKINNKIIPQIVQDVDLEKFRELEPNDILFIDSSHVVKTGSDVQHILFEILPVIESGVYIHFHDIFYPFQYSKEWVLTNQWTWNEQYFLNAFLMYNNQFKIILSANYLYQYNNKLLDNILHTKNIPYNGGLSFWLKKI